MQLARAGFRFFSLLLFTLLLTGGCSGGDEGEKSLGEKAGDAISDTEVLKEATAAANAILRNATDCEIVGSRIEEVNAKLDEVEQRLQTATGRTTLKALREQVRRVAESCGLT